MRRRHLVAGGLAAAAMTGTAIAQPIPSHTVRATVSPARAGTPERPRAVAIRLDIANDRAAGTTASRIRIDNAPGFRMNPRGFPVCSEATILDRGIGACPRGSRLGTGSSRAVVNPTSATPSNLTFRTTFVVGGRTFMNIFLEQTPGEVRAVLKGRISNRGRRLTIDIPEDLQQPAPGVYSALTDITSTLEGTTGRGAARHGFFELSRCPTGRLTVRTTLTYVPNPVPPARRTSTATHTSRCTPG